MPDLMTAANRAITAVLVALALAGSACAGLTPTSLPVAGPVPSSAAPERISPPPAEVSDLGGDWSADFALDRVPVASLPEGNAAAAPAHVEAKPVQVLADHQSSLSLCLYVLMGVGLCKTVPSVRKLSLGCIPDWYHDGGPSQVGHSHAIGPNLCPAPEICFLQPDSITGALLPEFHQGTLASLVRESVFTPTLLASRGPPLFC